MIHEGCLQRIGTGTDYTDGAYAVKKNVEMRT